jgi:hypothetical protein
MMVSTLPKALRGVVFSAGLYDASQGVGKAAKELLEGRGLGMRARSVAAQIYRSKLHFSVLQTCYVAGSLQIPGSALTMEAP